MSEPPVEKTKSSEPSPPYALPSRDELELQGVDWADAPDRKAKKRVQNRVAQRSYRQRIKARMEELQEKIKYYENRDPNTPGGLSGPPPQDDGPRNDRPPMAAFNGPMHPDNSYSGPPALAPPLITPPPTFDQAMPNSPLFRMTMYQPSPENPPHNSNSNTCNKGTNTTIIKPRVVENGPPASAGPFNPPLSTLSNLQQGCIDLSYPHQIHPFEPFEHLEHCDPHMLHNTSPSHTGLGRPYIPGLDKFSMENPHAQADCLMEDRMFLDAGDLMLSDHVEKVDGPKSLASSVGGFTPRESQSAASGPTSNHIPSFEDSILPAHDSRNSEVSDFASNFSIDLCAHLPDRPDANAPLEDRIAYVAESARLLGFDDFDAAVSAYYTSNFNSSSHLYMDQRLSRHRFLPRLISSVWDASKGWTEWERQGLREEILRGAESILISECNTLRQTPWFRNWSASIRSENKDKDGSLLGSEAQIKLQEELPNLWALVTALSASNNAQRQRDRNQSIFIAIATLCASTRIPQSEP